MNKALQIKVALLAAVPFLMVLGNSMLFPIFPKMQTALHLSEFQTSMVVTSFSVPAAILIPFAGYLADQYGRKIVIVPSVLIFGVGAAMAALASWWLKAPYTWIIVGRIVEGAGAAGMSQLAMAIVADMFQSKERSKILGMLEAANGFGKVVSPITGGLVGLISWYIPFFVAALFAFPLAILLWLNIKEPKRVMVATSLSAYIGKITKQVKDKGASLTVALLAGAVGLFILFGTLFYLSEVLEKHYRMPELTVGFILALPVAAMSITSFFMGMNLQKKQKLAKTGVWLGMAVVSVVMLVAAFSTHRWLLLGAITIMGFGGGLMLPSLTLLITSSVPYAERGMVTSFYGAVRFLGVALGPPTFGILMKSGPVTLFGSATVLTGITSLLVLIFMKPNVLLGGKEPSGPNPVAFSKESFGLTKKTRIR